ncbi:hypothetical protein LSUE1_G006039 [Lachnellula suecica]|uniref:Uncharacterized protein n=1 Tax=Lachnellula suecica TaxID=602035 RepID=A0A8T9C8K8_9HELO|nr:hypothetical protein LSUE1_G006039 [Lachnellula suecica]
MTTLRLPELTNGIVTSWIPLTTPAPAPYPSSCNSAFRLETLSGSITNIIAYDPWYGQAIDTAYQSCLAPEQTQWWAQQLMPTTVFNLGPFACPTPYTTATTTVVSAGTTLVACCPNNYAYQGSILPPLSGRQCLSALSSGQVITAKTGAIGPNNFTDTTATITATDVGIYGNQLNGFIFDDAIITASSTASPTSTSSSSRIPTPTSATVISSPMSALVTKSFLSTTVGKVVVYGVVPAGAVMLFGFIGMVLLYRRRASRRNKQFVELEATEIAQPPPRPPPPPQELWSPIEKEKKPVEMWAS